jgi:hypothetical protein
MPKEKFDPLAFIPSPHILREKLTEAVELADRLRILLDVSERVHADPPGPLPDEAAVTPAKAGKGCDDAR